MPFMTVGQQFDCKSNISQDSSIRAISLQPLAQRKEFFQFGDDALLFGEGREGDGGLEQPFSWQMLDGCPSELLGKPAVVNNRFEIKLNELREENRAANSVNGFLVLDGRMFLTPYGTAPRDTAFAHEDIAWKQCEFFAFGFGKEHYPQFRQVKGAPTD